LKEKLKNANGNEQKSGKKKDYEVNSGKKEKRKAKLSQK
jgi:hypothetical protein